MQLGMHMHAPLLCLYLWIYFFARPNTSLSLEKSPLPPISCHSLCLLVLKIRGICGHLLRLPFYAFVMKELLIISVCWCNSYCNRQFGLGRGLRRKRESNLCCRY